MKKFLLFNLLGLSLFFMAIVFIVSCGKAKPTEKKLPGQAQQSPKKFTPAMMMEAIEYIAAKLPAEEREDFLDETGVGELYEVTEEINEALAVGELKVSEISGKALGEALYQKVKGPRGAKARDKANRIKCANNLSQVYKAMLAFAQDNGERLPWQLTPSGVRGHLDAAPNLSAGYGRSSDPISNIVNHHPRASTVGGVFGIRAVMVELQTPKILHSPCDPSRSAANELIQENWENYNTKTGKLVPHDGLSYGLCFGADAQRPTTVLGTTRNLSTGDLATAKWLGAEDKLRGMLGLKISQGQMGQMDGSVRQANNGEIGANGTAVKAARTARGGVAKGKTSTKMMLPY